MEVFLTISKQVILMFCLMGFGYILFKRELINELGTKQISNMLVMTVTPFTILNSFNTDFSWIKLQGLLITLGFAIITMTIGIIDANIAFKKENRIEKSCAIFSNCGFIGIPIVQAVLGNESVFYMAAFIIATNLLQFTYGVFLISNKKELMTIKNALTNPGMIGISIGLLLFISPFKLSGVPLEVTRTIASLNTPLAMIVLGTFIANTGIGPMFRNKMGYYISLIRLLITPTIVILILMLLPKEFHAIKQVILIAKSGPVAVNNALLAQKYGSDYRYGAQIVGLSTILSMITMPLILTIADIIWRL